MKGFSLLVPSWEVTVGGGIRSSLTISAHSLVTRRKGAGMHKDGYCLHIKCVLTVSSTLLQKAKLSSPSPDTRTELPVPRHASRLCPFWLQLLERPSNQQKSHSLEVSSLNLNFKYEVNTFLQNASCLAPSYPAFLLYPTM